MEKTKVCVTGGAGYIGSWLVKKLLHKGYIVHATLRNLDDKSKIGLLKSLPNADTRLVLFEADIYNPSQFEPAIQGCRYVFHVATPLQHNTESSLYKDSVEAAIGGVRSIVDSCLKSQTVKRLVYTASIMASSSLKDDGTGFNYKWDESCWTPLNVPVSWTNDYLQAYTASKTFAEKEILSYKGSEVEDSGNNLEVVSLACALVGGDAILSYVPSSMDVMLSPLSGDSSSDGYKCLQHLQQLLGSVPLVHIEDVCEAHIFCIEKPFLKGRFLCSNADPTVGEIADYYKNNHPNFEIVQEDIGGAERRSSCNSCRLVEHGFKYKYNMSNILDDSVDCARRLGFLPPKY